jgi:surface polysaccharide O-acyltransferase-like enzyme
MQSKINWIDNLRGNSLSDGGDDPHNDLVCHECAQYQPVNWDVANILNSTSRVSVRCSL